MIRSWNLSYILLYTDDVLSVSSCARDLQTNRQVRTPLLSQHCVVRRFTMNLLSDLGFAWKAFLESINVINCMVIVTWCGVSRWLVSWPWLRLTWSARRSAPKPVNRRFLFNCVVHPLNNDRWPNRARTALYSIHYAAFNYYSHSKQRSILSGVMADSRRRFRRSAWLFIYILNIAAP